MSEQHIEDRLRALEAITYSQTHSTPAKAYDAKPEVQALRAEIAHLRGLVKDLQERPIPSIKGLIGQDALVASLEPIIEHSLETEKGIRADLGRRIDQTLGEASASADAAKNIAASSARAARDMLIAQAYALTR